MNTSYEYTHAEPPSFLSKLCVLGFRLSGIKRQSADKAREAIDKDSLPAPIPARMLAKFDVVQREFEGRPVWTLSPKGGRSDKVVLYLHGGAYIANIIRPHWNLIECLIDQTQASFMVSDYPLASAATCLDVFAYLERLMPDFHRFRANRPWTIMGDSAGGGLSYAWSQWLRNHGQPQANRIILLSPWLDISTTNPKQLEIDRHDPMLPLMPVRMAAKAYVGDVPYDDYRVSPLFGDLQNLPPVSVFTGTYDIVNADARELKDRLKSEHIPYNFYEYPKMFHVFMALTFLKEAKVAIGQISDLIRGARD